MDQDYPTLWLPCKLTESQDNRGTTGRDRLIAALVNQKKSHNRLPKQVETDSDPERKRKYMDGVKARIMNRMLDGGPSQTLQQIPTLTLVGNAKPSLTNSS
jgi:hypothetical protein